MVFIDFRRSLRAKPTIVIDFRLCEREYFQAMSASTSRSAIWGMG